MFKSAKKTKYRKLMNKSQKQKMSRKYYDKIFWIKDNQNKTQPTKPLSKPDSKRNGNKNSEKYKKKDVLYMLNSVNNVQVNGIIK